MTRSSRIAAALCFVLLASSISACTGRTHTPNASDTRSGVTRPSDSHTLDNTGCDPASPITTTSVGPEVQGSGHDATLYGLIMTATPMPVHVGEAVKIVWRMTGSGPLRLSTTSPQGNAVALQWGPEGHGGSNYDRPGDEWGAGYLFSSTGCWHLQARRTEGVADVWLQVQHT